MSGLWGWWYFGGGGGRNASGGFSRRPDSRAADRSGLQHPRLRLVDVYKMYGYFRTPPASLRPLISRVGQTIRRPLRIRINYMRRK